MKKLCLLFFIGYTGFATSVFSQQKVITSEEYHQPYREALAKIFDVSWRFVAKREFYEDGKLSSSVDVTDKFLVPDKRHYLRVEQSVNRINKVEIFRLGGNWYCKTNDGDWKKSESWCASRLSALSNIVGVKFTVEETEFNNQKVKLYQEHTFYKNALTSNKEKGGTSYWNSKYWLNSEGLILRRESKNALLNPGRVYEQQIESYEYNPNNLKIEAPELSEKVK